VHLPTFTSFLASSVMLVSTFAQAHTTLQASLDGAQEVPAVATSAAGTATFELEDDKLTYTIAASGLSGAVVAAHLHRAPRGQANPAPEIPLDTTLNGTTGELTAEQQDVLARGGFYVNLHTAANPGGEIRGQVELVNLAGTTCSCSQAASAAEFKRCVARSIGKLDREEQKELKPLRKAAKISACGKTKLPKKRIACCLGFLTEANVVIENMCAALSPKACAKRGGVSKGAGTSCLTTTCP